MRSIWADQDNVNATELQRWLTAQHRERHAQLEELRRRNFERVQRVAAATVRPRRAASA